MLIIKQLTRIHPIRRAILLVAVCALPPLLAFFLATAFMPAQVAAQDQQVSGFSPLTEIPATAQQVVVGVYPISVYNIDFTGNTYFVEAYIWFRWTGEIDPTATMEFINIVDQWGLIVTPIYEEPKTMPDGSLYQGMRISGRFSPPFLLEDYPMDQQKLSILIEDTTYSAEELVYIVDTKDTGYGETVKVPGWRIEGAQAESVLHKYSTEFGELGEATRNSNFSVLRYELTISRPLNFFIWKLLLPLIIILAMGLCALVIHPTQIDVRTAMPMTALLTTVFLQQSYTDALPDAGNLVLLDKIYVLAYLVIIASVIEVMWSAEQLERDPTHQTRVRRLDRVLLFSLLAVMVAGTTFLIMTR